MEPEEQNVQTDPENQSTITEQTPTPEQLFAQKYQALCQQTGYQVVVTPAYIKRDDGSYSTILQMSVGKMPK